MCFVLFQKCFSALHEAGVNFIVAYRSMRSRRRPCTFTSEKRALSRRDASAACSGCFRAGSTSLVARAPVRPRRILQEAVVRTRTIDTALFKKKKIVVPLRLRLESHDGSALAFVSVRNPGELSLRPRSERSRSDKHPAPPQTADSAWRPLDARRRRDDD